MQNTVAKSIRLTGVGLHSGKSARLDILPAPAEYGIWFRRVDVIGTDNLIPALYDFVNDTQLCTRIANEAGIEVSTIEHIMAALAGTGVHNALIEVNGPEVPIMDGSSRAFVDAILTAGIRELNAPVRAVRILKPVHVEFDDVKVSLFPSDRPEIDFEIDFSDKAIGLQTKSMTLSNGAFVRELSDCRTFCRRQDVEHMQSMGLALGGGLQNAVVVDAETVLNPEGFRWDDECVRHKMLDALGDLALSGGPILGRYVGKRAGHRATNLLLRKLFDTPDAFDIVICDDATDDILPGAHIRPEDLRRIA